MSANGTYSVEAVRALDTHRTPIQKQPKMLLCLVEIDLFSLIRAPNPTKVKTRSRPRAPHKLPLLTLSAPWVIKMDEPAVATDSSGVPSTIKRSPLDFAQESEASGRETAAPELPPPEEVPIATAPGTDQAPETVAVEPPVVLQSRKRGHEGIDTNAPPKSLRRDHADFRPSGSSHGGKSLAAMQLYLASNVFVSKGVPANVSDPNPLAFADAPLPHPADVAQSSQGVAVAEDLGSKNASSPIEVRSPGSVYRPDWGVTNGSLLDTPEGCQDLVDHAAPPGYFTELRHMPNEEFLWQYNVNLARQVAMGSQLRLWFEQEAKLLRKSVTQWVAALQEQVSGEEKLKASFEEFKWGEDDRVEQRWVIGHKLRLAMMKSVESLEMRRAFADVVSAGVTKGMSEGMKHGSLKDLKFPLLDQLESLKDAPMDVIMAALYLESDTRGDALQYIHDLRSSSSQLTIPVYPDVRDPRNL
nr:hypothetical protein [Tanacetum cinerariifolium]